MTLPHFKGYHRKSCPFGEVLSCAVSSVYIKDAICSRNEWRRKQNNERVP